MATFNKVLILGFIGRNPELRYTAQGTPVAHFSIATTEKRKTNGNANEVTTWFQVTAWGKLGEIVGEFARKGQPIYVEGRLSLAEWENGSAKPRTSLDVTATDVQFLPGNAKGSDDNRPPSQSSSPSTRKPRDTQKQKSPPQPDDNLDDDVPF